MEDYKFDYILNKGEFIKIGKDALWEPGKLDGKYLILCITSDKAGNEINAKKIISVNFKNCLSLTTDTTVYVPFYLNELYPYTIKLRINNNTSYRIIPRSFMNFPTFGILKKDNSSCVNYSYLEDTSNVSLGSGEEILYEWDPPSSTGIFRFFLPYRVEINDPVFADTLYSNEFKVVEENF